MNIHVRVEHLSEITVLMIDRTPSVLMINLNIIVLMIDLTPSVLMINLNS